MSERRGGSRWRDLPYRVPLFTERETLRCPPQSFSGHSCPDGPDAPDTAAALREVSAFLLVPTRALPTVRAPTPPSLFAPACGFAEASVPCSASRPLPRPLALPRRCAPKGCVCAHNFDIAMREERDAPPRGGRRRRVCAWRTNGATAEQTRGGAVDLSAWRRPRPPSLFFMRTYIYPPCAHAHPTPPRSPLHRSLSLSPHCSLSAGWGSAEERLPARLVVLAQLPVAVMPHAVLPFSSHGY